MTYDVRQAVFLVGGKGTRLGQLTSHTPKPLLPIDGNDCLLDILTEEAARHGFSKILLLAGHLGDQIKARFDGKKVRGSQISVLCEPEPLGTAGGLRWAAEALDPWFLLANGDSFFDINLRKLVAAPDDGFDARIALRSVDDISRYGAVISQSGKVTAFHEKDPGKTGQGDINAGVYLVSKRILGQINTGFVSLEREIFPALAASGRLESLKFDAYFIDMGLPDSYRQAEREIPIRRRRRCAFLDRDGVLNVDGGYTHKPEDLRWIKGAEEAVLALNDAGYLVIVITNQAGVAYGYYTEEDVDNFHDEMSRQLRRIGAHIDAFYDCPFHCDAKVDRYRYPDHPDRKPNPGMLLRALAEWRIDIPHSFLIGDKQSDLEAARAAGVRARLYEGGDLLSLVNAEKAI